MITPKRGDAVEVTVVTELHQIHLPRLVVEHAEFSSWDEFLRIFEGGPTPPGIGFEMTGKVHGNDPANPPEWQLTVELKRTKHGAPKDRPR